MMMNRSNVEMAKIYAFPLRPRALSSAVRLARLEAEARNHADVEFGSGWYHEEAIAEAGCTGKKRN
ncbi:MAG: DUF2735 domain-containing protein [Hyphomicrobiaceae bacterium]|nr:DUF2735 domain-containing protein [Hyphomicrobiaceae bacterium]